MWRNALQPTEKHVGDTSIAALDQEMAVMLLRYARLLDSRAAETRLAGTDEAAHRAPGARAEPTFTMGGQRSQWKVAAGFVHNAPGSRHAAGKPKRDFSTGASAAGASVESALHRYLGISHDSLG